MCLRSLKCSRLVIVGPRLPFLLLGLRRRFDGSRLLLFAWRSRTDADALDGFAGHLRRGRIQRDPFSAPFVGVVAVELGDGFAVRSVQSQWALVARLHEVAERLFRLLFAVLQLAG